MSCPPSWSGYSEAYPAGYYLFAEPLQSAPPTRITIRNPKTGKEQRLLNLASYNYLGISSRPEVKQAAIAAIEKYGLGASGSPILSGTFDIHLELARGRGRVQEEGILPSSFRPATAATWAFSRRIMRSGDTILARPVRARVVGGRRHPVEGQDGLLPSQQPARPRAQAVEAQGQEAGLRRRRLLDGRRPLLSAGDRRGRQRHGARIIIDEAHSTFLFGPNGRGVVEHFGLEDKVDFHLGTFSKSLGGQGGFVWARRRSPLMSAVLALALLLVQPLRRRIAAGLLAGLRIVENEPQLRPSCGATWPTCGGASPRKVSTSVSRLRKWSRSSSTTTRASLRSRSSSRPRALPPAGHLSGCPQAQVTSQAVGLGSAQRGRSGRGGHHIVAVLREAGVCR